MKKTVSLLLLISLLSLTACSYGNASALSTDASGGVITQIEVGMTYDDIERLAFEHLVASGFVFYKNESGDSVVGQFDPQTHKITAIHVFPAAAPDANAFASISVGTSVPDVVRIVGLPIGARTFGINSMDFACSDGGEYRISWNDDMTVLEVYPISN